MGWGNGKGKGKSHPWGRPHEVEEGVQDSEPCTFLWKNTGKREVKRRADCKPYSFITPLLLVTFSAVKVWVMDESVMMMVIMILMKNFVTGKVLIYKVIQT